MKMLSKEVDWAELLFIKRLLYIILNLRRSS